MTEIIKTEMFVGNLPNYLKLQKVLDAHTSN